jgi:uncharacterized protein (DUF885 family)
MKKAIKLTGFIFLGLFLVFAVFLANIIWFKPFSIRIFREKSFIELAVQQPELISQLRLPFRYFNSKFSDASPESEVKFSKWMDKYYRMLLRYNYNRLNEQEKLSVDILNWFLTDLIKGQPYMYYYYPVNQMFGIHSAMPSFMDSYHRVNDDRDARDYLIRLSKFPLKFSLVIESYG